MQEAQLKPAYTLKGKTDLSQMPIVYCSDGILLLLLRNIPRSAPS
ncbi:hypothetical protein [Paenibacillus peoriae]|nr:hypothetical protein [Paenibacillus peoriae]